MALAGTALGHHVISIDCGVEGGIDVEANIGDGHVLQVIINGEEQFNEAVDGTVMDRTFHFPWDLWPAFVEVTIFFPQGGFEDSMEGWLSCGEPDIDIDKSNDTEDNETPNTVIDDEGDGEAVTYTFKISNIGDTVLSNVEVVDTIFSGPDEGDPACEPLVQGADAPGNGDDLLEPGETWVYTCTRTLEVGEHDNEACVYADEWAPQVDTLTLSDGHDVSDCDDNEVTVVEGGTGGETGTPEGGSIPDTATSIPSQSSPLATVLFGALLVSSLGALAYANVRSSRRR
jgi:hypothetical protein